MGELLEALHRLQAVELKLAEIRGTEESKQGRIEANRRQLKKIDDRLAQWQASILDYKKRIDALTLDVRAREESISKHRDVLSKVKTNKEYAAILTAINTEKADNTKIETQVLQLMEQNSKSEERAGGIDAERAKINERLDAAERTLEEYQAAIQQERDSLQADRRHFAESIPPQALDTFTRVAEHHNGEAMVPVVKLDSKREEYACSGCNMTLTLEVINTLRTGRELQFCKVCGRLLYLEEQAAHSSG